MDLKGFAKQIGNFIGNLQSTHYQFNEAVGERFIEVAKPRTPVDTGLSRESWRSEATNKQVTIRNIARRDGIYYASFWNYDTTGYPGYHTLEISRNIVLQEMPGIYANTMRQAWAKSKGDN